MKGVNFKRSVEVYLIIFETFKFLKQLVVVGKMYEWIAHSALISWYAFSDFAILFQQNV